MSEPFAGSGRLAAAASDLKDPETPVIPAAQRGNVASELPVGRLPPLKVEHEGEVAVLPGDLDVGVRADNASVGDPPVGDVVASARHPSFIAWTRHGHVDPRNGLDGSEIAPAGGGIRLVLAIRCTTRINPNGSVQDAVNDMSPGDEVGGPFHVDDHDLGGP